MGLPRVGRGGGVNPALDGGAYLDNQANHPQYQVVDDGSNFSVVPQLRKVNLQQRAAMRNVECD